MQSPLHIQKSVVIRYLQNVKGVGKLEIREVISIITGSDSYAPIVVFFSNGHF